MKDLLLIIVEVILTLERYMTSVLYEWKYKKKKLFVYTCRIESLQATWSKSSQLGSPFAINVAVPPQIAVRHFVYFHTEALTSQPFDGAYDPLYMTCLFDGVFQQWKVVVLALTFLHRSTVLLYKN